jgi:hypothetical protein
MDVLKSQIASGGKRLMKFQGSVIKEQGITFAVVIVKKHIVDNRSQAEDTIRSFQPVFPGIPVVLMAQDSHGVPTYFGRPDIAKFLANVSLQRVPWKEYTIN